MTKNIAFSRRAILLGGACAALAPPVGAAGSPAPHARTKQGRVRGFRRNGACVFLGLPYGASTAGARRFLPPAPPARWAGVRDATRYGQRAPQPGGPDMPNAPLSIYFSGGRRAELAALGHDQVGEDCLRVNVLTPATDGKRRPVLFYIHGGGFTTGSGNVMALSDRLVVEEDVVLVTVNHRLGAFGYLHLGGLDPQFAAGNPGLLDLVAALEWVRDNIAQFGGDPGRVTLFGESGGGAKIGYLLAMPQASGLFHRAIVQSGLMPTPLPPTNDTATGVLDRLKLPRENVAALQAVPMADLLAAAGPAIVASPTADGCTLTADPWTTAPASAQSVPMIIGYCADELSLFAFAELNAPLAWPEVSARLASSFGADAGTFVPIVDAYRQAHPEATPAHIYSRMMTDATFGRDMVNLADRKARQTPPVYLYRMEYITSLAPQFRAFHTVELPLTGRLVAEPRAERLSRQIAGAWAAFARTGDPNHAGLPQWRARATAGPDVMQFDEVSVFGHDPQAAARTKLMQLVGNAPMDLRSGKLLPERPKP